MRVVPSTVIMGHGAGRCAREQIALRHGHDATESRWIWHMRTSKRFVLVNAESNEDSEPSQNPTHEEISIVAHQIYEQEGCPDGFADSHWHAAEARPSQ